MANGLAGGEAYRNSQANKLTMEQNILYIYTFRGSVLNSSRTPLTLIYRPDLGLQTQIDVQPIHVVVMVVMVSTLIILLL